jgi:two-component system, LytTR family, response regulator
MTRRIRTMIVDDEPIARRTLRLLLEKEPDVELVGECDGVEAAAIIAKARPDLLFLDIQMPEVDGFQLLERIGIETVPAIVFVTAYGQHALRAFEVDAVDYLLKPFDDERFAATLRRVKSSLVQPAEKLPQRYLRRLVIRTAGRILLVRVEDVDWIEAADYYARVHTGGKSYLIRQTMGELEQALDPAMFFRLHRSGIVNLDRIRELVPHFKGDYAVVLHTGASLRMAKGRFEELQRRLASDLS